MEQQKWFDSPEFEAEFHWDGPLGAELCREETVFRLWAPTAQSVELSLYRQGTGEEAAQTHSCLRQEKGVWVCRVQGHLAGWYYNYAVTVDGVTRRTADPYAVACGCNGSRSMVADLRSTDPEGWDDDRSPARQPEDIIWECHVKDFSYDVHGGFDEADRGKFTALCRRGTTLDGDGVHPTGLDYLRHLGVTHVQLLPVYDYGSVDESGSESQFNWGYDPVNYNVPEGSYSTDPHHGEVRIRELKQAVASLHQNGFRVIMDVVYNHTYSLDSWLFRTVPWYFYRQKPDGSPSNGSGCGNDLATERSMVRRYIRDSVRYWAREYHMDGFRFDLMGLLDAPLMEQIRQDLDLEFGPGVKQIYGEPWSADETFARPGTRLCGKDRLKQLPQSIGAFCDKTRDAVKGGLGQLDRGFVNGGGLEPAALRQCLGGCTRGPGSMFQSPEQAISYLSCHDDWTLWDRLVYTLDPERAFPDLKPQVLRANRLAAAMLFCCQGHLFFLSGEEFGRTKLGEKNSFRSSPRLNRLDWTRAWQAEELVDYYRGLIALRKQLPGLCDKSITAADRVRSVELLGPDCVGAQVENGGRWKTLYLLFNAGEAQTVKLPGGQWQILANGTNSFRWQQEALCSAEVRMPASSALLLGR